MEKLARQDDPAERLGLRRGSNADGRVGRPHGRVSAGDRVAGEACSEVEAVAFPVSIAVGAGHVALDADRARLRRKRNVLVYMVYSDRLIEGSPKNSTSTVPMMPWGASDQVQRCADFVEN